MININPNDTILLIYLIRLKKLLIKHLTSLNIGYNFQEFNTYTLDLYHFTSVNVLVICVKS